MADLVTVVTTLAERSLQPGAGTAGRSVLTDAKVFAFKGVVLAGNLVAWNDRIGQRLAVHRYLKRPGGEIEPMGTEPGRFTMRLHFLGPTWAKQYRAFVALIRDEPRGELVHPILGSIRVACEGVQDAGVVPGQEIDSIAVTATFIEDSLDPIALSDRFPGPSVQQGAVNSSAAALVDRLAGFATAYALAVTLAGDAISLGVALRAEFAGSGAGQGAPDPSLDSRLASCAAQTDALVAAIRADAAARGDSDGSAYGAIEAAQQTYAGLLAMAEAMAASRPALVLYVVPADTNIATLSASLYGADGLARIDEILRLNRIPDPYLIRAGTRLRVSTPSLPV